VVKRGANWINKHSNIEHFKLVSTFSRIGNEHGGTCIHVRKYVQTKEQNCLQELCKEKDFEMSVAELLVLDYEIVLVGNNNNNNNISAF
jgi:hypothetical protein